MFLLLSLLLLHGLSWSSAVKAAEVSPIPRGTHHRTGGGHCTVFASYLTSSISETGTPRLNTASSRNLRLESTTTTRRRSTVGRVPYSPCTSSTLQVFPAKSTCTHNSTSHAFTLWPPCFPSSPSELSSKLQKRRFPEKAHPS